MGRVCLLSSLVLLLSRLLLLFVAAILLDGVEDAEYGLVLRVVRLARGRVQRIVRIVGPRRHVRLHRLLVARILNPSQKKQHHD